MFKDIQRGFEKFFTMERVLILMVVLVLGFILFSYSSMKGNTYDLMSSGGGGVGIGSTNRHVAYSNDDYASNDDNSPNGFKSSDLITDNTSKKIVFPEPMMESKSGGYALQPVANPNDLLPKDENSQWGELNQINANNITTPDLLQAGYHIGLDTIGQTLRNANLQERSDPIIPKSVIGPWNQSTIEPDFGRTPLEVGFGPR
jgi:hypothetical protein